ncbi:MAG: hypothetical protein ACRCS6_06100, partial [Turicibacter sp.]
MRLETFKTNKEIKLEKELESLKKKYNKLMKYAIELQAKVNEVSVMRLDGRTVKTLVTKTSETTGITQGAYSYPVELIAGLWYEKV